MNYKVLLGSFALVFLAELGDKTQLTALAFSAQSRSPWAVFIGTSLALISTTAIAVVFGSMLTKFVPERVLHLASGVMFVLVGLILLVNMARKAPAEEPESGEEQGIEAAAARPGALSSFILLQAMPFEEDLAALANDHAVSLPDGELKQALLRIADAHRSHGAALKGIGSRVPTGADRAPDAELDRLLTEVDRDTPPERVVADMIRHQEAAAEFYIALARMIAFHDARDALRDLAMEEIRLAQDLCDLVNHPAADAV